MTSWRGLFKGYGYKPYFLEGDDPLTMHEGMAAVMDEMVAEIRRIQKHARDNNDATRPIWPMLVLRTPKGWTGPKFVDGKPVEGYVARAPGSTGRGQDEPGASEATERLDAFLQTGGGL